MSESESTFLEPQFQRASQAFGKDTTKTLEKKAKSIADKAHFVGTHSVVVLQSHCCN